MRVKTREVTPYVFSRTPKTHRNAALVFTKLIVLVTAVLRIYRTASEVGQVIGVFENCEHFTLKNAKRSIYVDMPLGRNSSGEQHWRTPAIDVSASQTRRPLLLAAD